MADKQGSSAVDPLVSAAPAYTPLRVGVRRTNRAPNDCSAARARASPPAAPSRPPRLQDDDEVALMERAYAGCADDARAARSHTASPGCTRGGALPRADDNCPRPAQAD